MKSSKMKKFFKKYPQVINKEELDIKDNYKVKGKNEISIQDSKANQLMKNEEAI